MLGTYFTFPELLVWIPLFAGIITFLFKNETTARTIALTAALATLVVSCISLCYYKMPENEAYNTVNYYWMKQIGSSLYMGLDNTGHLLTFLTAVAFPIIFIAGFKNNYKNPNAFYGLMLLAQAGIMGVFISMDALLFYFCWELALIPVYFLCSYWGGEKRIQATFKFFIYTFLGSLLMLVGILTVYMYAPGRTFEDGTIIQHSFSLSAFYQANIPAEHQQWLFWLFFAAFAVKMPVFPFHTWQPDTYDQSPTGVTMVLSGLMVKMGLFGVLRWLVPVLPAATAQYANIVMLLSIAGILYASLIALVQDNIKRLIAYSSIAHIGLMCAAIFSMNQISLQGMMIQMFNHGINIIGLWIVTDIVERKTGVKQLSQLGGMAQKAPVLTWMLVIIALANIALPLTNGFIGEFMMFTGLFQFNVWFAVAAGIGIILSAVYTLNMIQKIFYGEVTATTAAVTDINFLEKAALLVLIGMIILLGVFPQPLIDLTKNAVATLLGNQ